AEGLRQGLRIIEQDQKEVARRLHRECSDEVVEALVMGVVSVHHLFSGTGLPAHPVADDIGPARSALLSIEPEQIAELFARLGLDDSAAEPLGFQAVALDESRRYQYSPVEQTCHHACCLQMLYCK